MNKTPKKENLENTQLKTDSKVRDKEEELENSLTKIDNLRQVVALTQQITLICFFLFVSSSSSAH